MKKIKDIKIIIDYQIKSFKELSSNCKYIESINFKKFNSDNIINMSKMFYGCLLLKEINFSKLILIM